MRAVSFWTGGKGGVGKSTLALNVAGDLHFRDPSLRIVVYDIDPQGTLSTLVAPLGNLPFKIISGVPDGDFLKKNIIDFVILDYPPNYTLIQKLVALSWPWGPHISIPAAHVKPL